MLEVEGRGTSSASSRENPSAVCVRSFVPKEKKSASSAISSARRAARKLDHRPAEVRDLRLLACHALGQLAEWRALAETHEQVHDLDQGRFPVLSATALAARTISTHLHLVDLRELKPEPATAVPSIGFASWSARMRSRIVSDVASSSGGRNSCSGGSSSRIVAEPVITSKIPLEIALLQREQPVERTAALVLVARGSSRARS